MIIPIANIFQPLIDIADWLLRWFHDSGGVPWGWSIILLTVVVRAALVPLTYKQLKSMARMQEFQPAIKEIQEKHKDDPQRKQKETMQFFKENKINPLASCLPLLMQLPVFIALFYALQDDVLQEQIRADGAHFLFIESLVEKSGGLELVTLLALYIGSQLASSLVTMASISDKNQRRLMLALPILFVPLILSFPAGLLVYWITTNFWTLGQSLVVRKIRNREAAHAELDPAVGGVSAGGAVAAVAPKKAPPPPPRQKRKRSGRRR